ncbi:hypothetical protein [Corynebacterium mastitidis]|uniref:hypothetical protein n=1 Tax=Corynebacterium mastitidis TaxID=161890 RepID=UPI0030E93B73
MTNIETTGDMNTDQESDGHVQGVLMWTPQKAADECQVGRSTIMRKLYADEIPGAKKIDGTWQIPVPGLIAAGFKPGRPAPSTEPDQDANPAAQEGVRESDRTGTGVPAEELYAHLREIAELKAQIEVEKARVSVEVARREAAEQLAEERRGRITDLQQALRMLTPSTKDREKTPVEAPGKLTESSTTLFETASPAAPRQNHAAEPTSPETVDSDVPAKTDKTEPQGMLSRIRKWFV